MNPLTNVRNIAKLNEQDIRNGVFDHNLTWHSQYKDSAYIFIGGLPYELTEGDVLAVFSQYGEIVNINLVRDKKTGKSKGYGFLAYEDQRSTVLAVDNFNSIKLGGRTIRVDHVSEYRRPLEDEKDESGQRKEKIEQGCAPKTPSPPASSDESVDDHDDAVKLRLKLKTKKKKKEKKKKRKREKVSNSESEDETNSSMHKKEKRKKHTKTSEMSASDSDNDFGPSKMKHLHDFDGERDNSPIFRKTTNRTDDNRRFIDRNLERRLTHSKTSDNGFERKRYSGDFKERERNFEKDHVREKYPHDRDSLRIKRRDRSRSR